MIHLSGAWSQQEHVNMYVSVCVDIIMSTGVHKYFIYIQ